MPVTRVIGLLLVALAWLGAEPVRAQIPSAPIAFWQLDGNAIDSSGNSNNGVSNGNATWGSARLGSGVVLDGATGSNIQVAGNTGLRPAEYAISAWVKYETTDTNGADVVTMGDNYGLRVQPSGQVKTYFSYAGGWRQAVSDAKTNDGSWHHILGQYDSANDRLEVYVDGNLSGPVFSTADAIAYSRGSDLFIGQHGNGSELYNFTGTIDHVRVYGKALTQTEIAALATEAPGATSFTVLTWNLRKGRATNNGDSVADGSITDFVKTTGADVLLLSAVQTLAEAQVIQAQMGSGWGLYWQKASDTSEGQAVLSHFPMPANPGDQEKLEVNCTGDTENQVIVKAVVTIAGKNINFFAVDQQHGGANSSVRACQAAQFRDWANSKPGLRIAGGDFNSTPTDPGITTWLTPAAPAPPDTGYTEGWGTVPSVNRSGYSNEGSSTGNTNGRTLTQRIDYIIRSKQSSSNLTMTNARVWDTRRAGTTCNMLASDGYLDRNNPCTGDCSTCTWVDDKGVRPTDHVPLTVRFVIF